MGCTCFGASDKKGPLPPQHQPDQVLGNVNQISYKELSKATENFHVVNKIGKGGFGTVYKVEFAPEVKQLSKFTEVFVRYIIMTVFQDTDEGILRNGREVAVKPLSAGSRQGTREFLTEIQTISTVKHPNLVELIGCCIQGADRILVYEFVENNSLDRALLGRSTKVHLSWEKRAAVCVGVARGLAFLHEETIPHIVHRDIKASNILLDRDFNPKIGDFGLAKLFPDDITHISTRIAGTTGYLAPEYALGGQLTKKADVYSFGILVLEIISGRSSSKMNWGGTDKLLIEWVWQLYEEGKLLELVDPELGEYPQDEVIRYIKVALFCTQEAANRRPDMTQVLQMLTRNIRLNEELLTAPGYFPGSSFSKKSGSESTSYQMSSVPVTITQVTPR